MNKRKPQKVISSVVCNVNSHAASVCLRKHHIYNSRTAEAQRLKPTIKTKRSLCKSLICMLSLVQLKEIYINQSFGFTHLCAL